MAIPEPDLPSAATNIVADLYPRWTGAADAVHGIQPTALAFCTALQNTFPGSAPGGQPCANLIAIIWAQATNLPAPSAANIPMLDVFFAIVLNIYKLLRLANQLATQATPQITNAQATAVLSAFNTSFA